MHITISQNIKYKLVFLNLIYIKYNKMPKFLKRIYTSQ